MTQGGHQPEAFVSRARAGSGGARRVRAGLTSRLAFVCVDVACCARSLQSSMTRGWWWRSRSVARLGVWGSEDPRALPATAYHCTPAASRESGVGMLSTETDCLIRLCVRFLSQRAWPQAPLDPRRLLEVRGAASLLPACGERLSLCVALASKASFNWVAKAATWYDDVLTPCCLLLVCCDSCRSSTSVWRMCRTT